MDRSSIRETAYKAIDGERAYQDRAKSTTQSLGELTLLTGIYADKAAAAWADSKSPADGKIRALGYLRKVAALSVKAMELHGVEFRQ